MNEDIRGKTVIHYPEGCSGPDPASTGNVLLAGAFSGLPTPRSRDELRKSVRPVQVDSVRDICQAFDIRIEGTYQDVDGEPVTVCIPVRDETTFTPEGLTINDPGLFRRYIESRQLEQLAEYLARNGRDALTDEEIAVLENHLRVLDESLKGGE